MTIHIDLDTVKIQPALPRELPTLRHVNMPALENLRDAVANIGDDHWELDDGDVGIRRGDYLALIKAYDALERAGR